MKIRKLWKIVIGFEGLEVNQRPDGAMNATTARVDKLDFLELLRTVCWLCVVEPRAAWVEYDEV